MVTYIAPPFETDADELVQQAYDAISTQFPNWVPHDGNLVAWLTQVLLNMVANGQDIASTTALSIFRYFGQTVIGLQPVDAVSATTATTWTMQDAAGYTIPAGTQVAFATAGDNLVAFVTTDEVTVDPGDITTAIGAVNIIAVDPGAANNNLGPAGLQLLDSLAYVTNIAAVSATGGGVDAESDETYIGRLIEYLQLMTPTPVLAPDFALLSRNIAGVARATGIDNYIPARSITDAHTTNASAIVTSPALAKFTSDDVGRAITGAGIPAGTTVLTVDSATQIHLSANATATANPVTLTIAKNATAMRAVTVSLIDTAGQPVSAAIKTAVVAYLQSLRESNFLVNVMDPTYTVINVNFTFTPYPGFDANLVKAAAIDALTAYLLPGNWGTDPTDQSGATWNNETIVRYNEVVALLNSVQGLRFVDTLTLNTVAANVNLVGDVALPEPGAITGAVT